MMRITDGSHNGWVLRRRFSHTVMAVLVGMAAWTSPSNAANGHDLAGLPKWIKSCVVDEYGCEVLRERGGVRRIDVATARGDVATADADGEVRGPRRLWVRANASRLHPVDVSWSADCSTSDGDGGLNTGTMTLRSSKPARLRMPMAKPDSCSFGALGVSSAGGRLRVTISAWAPPQD